MFWRSGQEAVYVGMKYAMRDMDSVITSYRAHGFTYTMGRTVEEILGMDELVKINFIR